MRTILDVLESERKLIRQVMSMEQHLQTVESMLLESDKRVKELESVITRAGFWLMSVHRKHYTDMRQIVYKQWGYREFEV